MAPEQEAQQRIEQAWRDGATELELSLGLIDVPESISRLINLKRLDLFDNRLSKLPEAIAHLTNLQWFNLSNNQLSELPEEIAHLTNLQMLFLKNNQLSELPEEIGQLRSLEDLNLSDNQLTDLPTSLGGLSNLRLYLNNNPFNPYLAAAYAQGTEALQQYLRAKEEQLVGVMTASLSLRQAT